MQCLAWDTADFVAGGTLTFIGYFFKIAPQAWQRSVGQPRSKTDRPRKT